MLLWLIAAGSRFSYTSLKFLTSFANCVLLLIFFVLLLFATVTSSIALLEVVVAIGIGDKTHTRKKATWIFAAVIFIIGIPSALSFGLWSDILIFDRSIFDFVDYVTSSWLMPIGALLLSLFVGYYYSKKITREEMQSASVILIRASMAPGLPRSRMIILKGLFPSTLVSND